MPFRETPEEWARRTAKGELSPGALDALGAQPHDMLGERHVVPAEGMAGAARRLIDGLLTRGHEIDFIGNWWLAGNPYKGLNFAILDHDSYQKYELQLHTRASLEQAKANRPDYVVFRNRKQPLALRQAAFDRMVERFAAVPHPPDIEGIGTPIPVARLVAAPLDPHEEILARVRAVAAQVAAARGAREVRVETIQPEYPAALRFLLDRGRDRLTLGHFRTALQDFDRLIAEFGDGDELWTKRGVANATVNAGVALEQLGRLDEALARFDRVIAQAEVDRDVWQEATYAEHFRRKALEGDGPNGR